MKFFFFLRFYLFSERGKGGREKERERNINVWLPLTHSPLGTQRATQACAPTGNGTHDPLVLRPALNPLNHTSQGCFEVLKSSFKVAMEAGGEEIVVIE